VQLLLTIGSNEIKKQRRWRHWPFFFSSGNTRRLAIAGSGDVAAEDAEPLVAVRTQRGLGQAGQHHPLRDQ